MLPTNVFYEVITQVIYIHDNDVCNIIILFIVHALYDGPICYSMLKYMYMHNDI